MNAKKSSGRGRTLMRVPSDADLHRLRERVSAKGPFWARWSYKLHRDRIVISVPSPAGGRHHDEAGKPYLRRHLRVTFDQPGPFRLEWLRHTGRWWPLSAVGSIDDIADAILSDAPGTTAFEEFDFKSEGAT